MKNKLIRDSIHGYIELPEIVVNRIIDTPVFQRLRQIEQTSMRALYPSAHHDRFVHSLGVFHLGKLAFKGLINNIKAEPIFRENELFWNHYGVCFELACLLHDCGHAPMSHSFEYGYLNANNLEDCKSKHDRLLKSMVDNLDESFPSEIEIIEQCRKDVDTYFSNPQKIAPHELVSAILVSEYYGKSDSDGKNNIIREVLSSIFDESIDNAQLSEYIIFIQRAIIGLPYSNINSNQNKKYFENCFKNCLISLLNGNFFDVDKLDYIIRDTVESGANNISIDIPRILNALTLVEIHQFETETNVNDLELNNSVYFTGCNGELFDKSEKSNSECALNLSGVRLKGSFLGTIELSGVNNNLKTPTSEGQSKGYARFSEQTDIDAYVGDSCKLTGRFNGHIEMLGYADTKKVDGIVTAKVSGKILGEIVGKINTDVNHKLTYRVGYLKTAISVIEDTLIARNRLYLWTYAHHKVTYHDYILRQGILRSFLDDSPDMGELEKNQKANELLSNSMSIDDMFFGSNSSPNYLLSDGDLIHQMKISLVKNGANNPFAQRWLDRDHMHPVWKSYAEYNSFFANLTLSQRKKMWNLLFNSNNDGQTMLSVVTNEANSLEFNNSVLYDFSKDYSYTWIKPSGFKLKEMDVSNIYIVLSDNSVKRLKDVITQAKVTEQYVDESFFYLFTSEKLTADMKLELISYLKTAVKR